MTTPSSIETLYTNSHRTAFSAVGIPASRQLNQIGCHRWRPTADVSLALDDLGSLQGATLVERLRTVASQSLDGEEHLDRLRQNAKELAIEWPCYLTSDLIGECIRRNLPIHQTNDFAIVILLTPGHSRALPIGSTPTVIMHTADLNWAQLAHWYQHGQPLVLATNRNVPGSCWSPHMKTRSRMHYFLADQQAAASQLPFAGAIMLSLDGHITESSVANVLLIDGEQLVSPPIDSVLHGLSLRRTIRLAEQLGIPVRYENISIAAAERATGMLLTGSSGCLWPASQLGSVHYPNCTENSIYQRLRQAWIEDIGLDYTAQALATQRR